MRTTALSLFLTSQFPTENRRPLFLELLGSFAIPDGKTDTTFPGIAWFVRNSGRKTENHFCWNCLVRSQFRTENRNPLFLELLGSFAIPDGKPETTFPGIAWFVRNSGRKTGNHFSWNCWVRSQFRTENRRPLFLELPGSFAIPDGKPETTFPGIALDPLDLRLSTHIGLEDCRNANAAILVLIVLHYSDQRTANRNARTVQRVGEARLLLTCDAVARVHAARLEISANRAGGDFAVALLPRQPDLDVIGF